MKLNKKLFGVASAGLMAAGLFAGCAGGASQNTNTIGDNGDKLKVVTTIYPEYDWVKNVAGDNANVELLLKNGIDMHNYSPSVEDMAKISDCDLFVYVGGPSDSWVEGALKNASNKDMKVVKLLDVVADSLKEEETVEGMQENEHGHEHEDEKEYDEHVWTSLRNASTVCDAIAETLTEMDPENKDIYQSNAEAYQKKLANLDAEYQNTVENAKQNTLLFADRFPFRYLTDDYGLNYYAAFSGCSAESEASFKTITFLARKIDELGLNSVFTIEKSDDRIAQTVIENTKTKDQNILVLNSMQSITAQEIADGTTYLSVMKENLKVLKEALN